MTDQTSRTTLFTLMLTFFLDFVGLFMVAPIFSPLFLDRHSPMLALDTPYIMRTLIVGLLVASYGVGQFFGGPILGELSDQFGRKKVLMIGLSCLVIANILGGYSLIIHALPVLFIARFITGIASGNGSVLFAAVSDMSADDTQRGINLGYLTGAASLGCVVGPIVGARLSDPNLISWFHYPVPFFVMSGVFVLNMGLLYFTFKDNKVYQRRKLHFFTGIQNFFEYIKKPNINLLLLIYFLFVFSTESIFVSMPIFAVEKFKVNSVFLGDLFAIGAVFSAFASIYLNKKISGKVNSRQIFLFTTCLLTISYLIFFIPNNRYGLFIPWILAASTMVLAWAHANSIIAGQVDASVQGKILGVTQSLLSLAIILGPTSVGLIAAAHYNLAILLSAVACALSVLIFLFWRKQIINPTRV